METSQHICGFSREDIVITAENRQRKPWKPFSVLQYPQQKEHCNNS